MRGADVATFRQLIRKADPGTLSSGGPASPRLPGRGATRLAELLDDRVLSAEASAEIGLFAELAGGDDAVLTQADPCPGNIVIPADGGDATFIDFEASSVHHPAVDLAHLQVPWVSCDDSGQVSEVFREAAMAGYREVGPGVRTWLPWLRLRPPCKPPSCRWARCGDGRLPDGSGAGVSVWSRGGGGWPSTQEDLRNWPGCVGERLTWPSRIGVGPVSWRRFPASVGDQSGGQPRRAGAS